MNLAQLYDRSCTEDFQNTFLFLSRKRPFADLLFSIFSFSNQERPFSRWHTFSIMNSNHRFLVIVTGFNDRDWLQFPPQRKGINVFLWNWLVLEAGRNKIFHIKNRTHYNIATNSTTSYCRIVSVSASISIFGRSHWSDSATWVSANVENEELFAEGVSS